MAQTEAQKRADRKYRSKTVQVIVRFDTTKEEDRMLLAYVKGHKNQSKFVKRALLRQFTDDSLGLLARG